MKVANTILEQLGGQKFLAMTGANHLVADGNTLRMTRFLQVRIHSGYFCEDGLQAVPENAAVRPNFNRFASFVTVVYILHKITVVYLWIILSLCLLTFYCYGSIPLVLAASSFSRTAGKSRYFAFIKPYLLNV